MIARAGASHLPLKADLARCDAEGFRVVRLRDPSNAANTILLDHLISPGEERRWYFKSERVVYLSLAKRSLQRPSWVKAGSEIEALDMSLVLPDD